MKPLLRFTLLLVGAFLASDAVSLAQNVVANSQDASSGLTQNIMIFRGFFNPNGQYNRVGWISAPDGVYPSVTDPRCAYGYGYNYGVNGFGFWANVQFKTVSTNINAPSKYFVYWYLTDANQAAIPYTSPSGLHTSPWQDYYYMYLFRVGQAVHMTANPSNPSQLGYFGPVTVGP